MKSRASLLGHPVHQILVMFPIGALGFSIVSDVLHSLGRGPKHASAARQALDFSLISAAAAVPFGALDWLAIRSPSRAKRVGAAHALGNIAVLGLFLASRVLRRGDTAPPAAKWLSTGGLMLASGTAWLGTELVNRHGVGIHGRIGLDVPSSLSSASEPALQSRGLSPSGDR
jgi:uncharacterized membrane protein